MRPRRTVLAVAAAVLLLLAVLAALIVVRSVIGPRVATRGGGSGSVMEVQMLDASVGWGSGSGIVVRTNDGAATLRDVTPTGIDAASRVAGTTALDANHAWVLVKTLSTPARWSVFRTDNAGAAWIQTPIHEQNENAAITFVDRKHGWLQLSRMSADHRANQVTLLRTQDGGMTWSAVYHTVQRITIQPNIQIGDCQWSLVRFTTPLNGFAGLGCDATAGSSIDVTHDGGATWRRVTLPVLQVPDGVRMFSSVGRPIFSASGNGVVFASICVGDGRSCFPLGALYRSTDGGSTWTPGSIVRAGAEAVFSDPLHAWMPYGCLEPCGSTALLLRTQDGGAKWSAETLPVELGPNMHGNRQFRFGSPSAGLAVASQPGLVQFYRTADGGRTFVPFTPRILHG